MLSAAMLLGAGPLPHLSKVLGHARLVLLLRDHLPNILHDEVPFLQFLQRPHAVALVIRLQGQRRALVRKCGF